ncbi:hypothetical protein Tco_0261326 [Tanacetum coccineum]
MWPSLFAVVANNSPLFSRIASTCSWSDIPIEGWMMMENKRCGELMIESHWMDKILKEVLMIDELSIVGTDKVNHTVKMDMLKLVVEVECFEPEDVIEVENTIESEDETVPASAHEVGESSTAPFLREDTHALVEKKGKAKDEYYGKLILDLGNEVCSSVEQGTAAMEKLVEKLGNAEDKAECKKLNKELEEARGFVFEERLNETIEVPVKDEERATKESRGKSSYCYSMIKESIDAAIAAERARHANARNDARGSRSVMGQDVAPAIHECTFAGFIKCNPTIFHGTEGAVELQRWFEKTESIFGISECAEGKKVMFTAATLQGPALTWWNAEVQRMEPELWNLKVKEYNIVSYTQRFNELALICPRIVEPERVKVDAYIWGLTDNIKGEVTFSKHANLNKAVRMSHKLMEQKSQARDERILEGKKRKWENYQSGNSSGKSNHMDNSRQTSQNNQKQGNA